jgi:hypothetical protein
MPDAIGRKGLNDPTPNCVTTYPETFTRSPLGGNQPKATRELGRVALETNCRVAPVPFALRS